MATLKPVNKLHKEPLNLHFCVHRHAHSLKICNKCTVGLACETWERQTVSYSRRLLLTRVSCFFISPSGLVLHSTDQMQSRRFSAVFNEISSRRWQKSNKFHPGVHNANLIMTFFHSEALGSRVAGLSQRDDSSKVQTFVRQFIFVKEPSHTLSLSIYVEGLSVIPKPDKEGATNSRSTRLWTRNNGQKAAINKPIVCSFFCHLIPRLLPFTDHPRSSLIQLDSKLKQKSPKRKH